MPQAGEIWGTVLHSKFVEWGFKQSSQDQRLYIYKSGEQFINLIVVVDDMALSSNNPKLLEWFKNKQTQAFKVKLLGTLKLFIGWEFTYAENGLYIGQEKYVKRLLTEHNMQHVKPVNRPLPTKCNTTEANENEKPLTTIEHRRYR